MREIVKKGIVLARHVKPADIKTGLNFFTENSGYIQAGVWGHYEKGKELQPHIHKEFERTALRTYELLYIIKGSIEASVYDFDRQLVEKLNVREGEILILMECGHGYRIMSEDTTVLEVKNGPYAGAEEDRYKF